MLTWSMLVLCGHCVVRSAAATTTSSSRATTTTAMATGRRNKLELQHRNQQEATAAHRPNPNRWLQQAGTNPKKGTVKVLVILVYFSDHPVPTLDPTYFQTMWSTDIKKWFALNSHDNYNMDPVVVPEWFAIDKTEQYYADGVSGFTDTAHYMGYPALDALDKRPDWDWSSYDSNGDGYLDAVVFLHSGAPAEQGSIDCGTNGKNPENRIWSRGATSPSDWNDTWESTQAGNQKKLFGYVIASAFGTQCTGNPAEMGIITHEYMHMFGLPDLYDTSEADPKGLGIGGFDIMSFPYGEGNDNNSPGHLSAWSKMQARWLDPTYLSHDGVFVLRPAETFDDVINIDLGPFGEYLLLENRQPIEFDAKMWGIPAATGGLVIYHVDETTYDDANRGYPGQSGWPQNGNHYKVAVLQADGQYDLEKGNNNGDTGDYWLEGMVLGPGENNSKFPSTDSYANGSVEETGITITVLPTVCRQVVFQVSGLGTAPASYVPDVLPTVPADGCPQVAVVVVKEENTGTTTGVDVVEGKEKEDTGTTTGTDKKDEEVKNEEVKKQNENSSSYTTRNFTAMTMTQMLVSLSLAGAATLILFVNH